MTRKKQNKHSKSPVIALLPVLAFIFLMSLIINMIGDRDKHQKKPLPAKHQQAKNDGVTILPYAAEDKPAIANR